MKPEEHARIRKVRWGRVQGEDTKQEVRESMGLLSYFKNSVWMRRRMQVRAVSKKMREDGRDSLVSAQQGGWKAEINTERVWSDWVSERSDYSKP